MPVESKAGKHQVVRSAPSPTAFIISGRPRYEMAVAAPLCRGAGTAKHGDRAPCIDQKPFSGDGILKALIRKHSSSCRTG